MTTKLFSWSRMSLFLGPLNEATRHVHGAPAWCIGLERELGYGAASAPLHPHRTVSISPGVEHRLHGASRPIAVLYFSPDGQALSTPSPRLVTLLNDVYRSRLPTTLSSLEHELWAEVSAEGSTDSRVRQTGAQVLQHLVEPETAATLARSVGLSADRLRHLFRAQTGVSMRRYRVWHRCLAALSRAVQGESLTHAALELGFSSSAHFSAQFRASFGVAPSTIVRAKGLEVVNFAPFAAGSVGAAET